MGLAIPCLGTVPFDPELARHCDLGIPLAEPPETPVGRALEQMAQRLPDGLDRVTVAELERIRARMSTPKIFG